MGDYENGWNLVQRRRKIGRRKPDVFCDEGWKKNNGEGVTYFFSRFPENFGAKEMYRAFANYGRVVDVVIPAKRDKLGHRFGFARFVGVSDPSLFGTKLDNIIIGATKIFVNSPRFKRDDGHEGIHKKRNNKTKEDTENRYGEGKHRLWKEKKQENNKGVQQKTYAEVVRESKGKCVLGEEETEQNQAGASREPTRYNRRKGENS